MKHYQSIILILTSIFLHHFYFSCILLERMSLFLQWRETVFNGNRSKRFVSLVEKCVGVLCRAHTLYMFPHCFIHPVGCRIHQLYLCKGVKPSPTNNFPGYVTKPSDSEAPILELWGMWSTPSLSLFQASL